MKFTSPNGRSYEWDKPTPPTQADIDALVAYDNSLGKKSAGEKAADVAGDIAVEAGAAMGGQLLGAETGPGYFVVAPAAGAYGNYLKQQREIDRGERENVSYGEMLSSALINLIPASSMLKTGATVGRTVAKQAAFGAAIGATPEVAKTVMDERRWPTLDDYYTYMQKAAGGAALGAAAGTGLEMAKNLSPAAKKLWSRMSGKTQDEANQTIQKIIEEGSEAEKKAAGEIFDAVGQDLGLVRPVAKSAEEAAQTLRAAGTAEESAKAMLGEGAVAGEYASRKAAAEAAKQRQQLVERTARGAEETVAAQAPTATRALSPAEEAAQALKSAGSAEEAAKAFLGEQAVLEEMALRKAAEQAAIERQRLVEATAKQAEEAVASQRPFVARQLSPAEESAQVLGTIGTAQESARAMLPFLNRAIEGQPGGGTLAAQIRNRYQREGQFLQSQAQELEQALKAGQRAQPETIALTPPSQVQRYLAGETAETLAKPSVQEQLTKLDARSAAAARERAKLREKMGIQEEVLPTTEDVLNEFASLRGIGSKQRAKAMELQSGRASAGVIGALGAAGVLGVGATEAMANEKPKTIVVETEMGPLKYNTRDWSLGDIEQDVAKKRKEFEKIKAAQPHLELRQNYENAPDDQSRLKMLFDWSNSRKMAGEAAKVMMQAAGSRLPMAARPVVGAGAEMTRGVISGERPTEGQIAQSAIQMLPRGGTSFGSNLLQFAGYNVAGEAAKEAIDRGDLIDFKTAADAAARGGVQAAAMQAVTSGPIGRREAQKQSKFAGEVEVFKEADRLGIVLDPSATVGATMGQIMAVKAAGGSPRFQADASRVNIPRVQEKFVELAGRTGNPELDGKLSPAFFQARRLEEGQIYGQVAKLPGMSRVVQDWKDANYNAAKEYANNARTGKPEALEAARQYRDQANSLFGQIELAARKAGGQQMVDDLQRARLRISQLHAMESAVNPASFLPDNVQSMGQMFRDNPNYFTGDLRSIARIAAAQPGVFGEVTGTRALAKQDLAAVPFLRAFLQTGPGQRSVGTYGPEPLMLAQLARFGAGTALEQRPTPYR